MGLESAKKDEKSKQSRPNNRDSIRPEKPVAAAQSGDEKSVSKNRPLGNKKSNKKSIDKTTYTMSKTSRHRTVFNCTVCSLKYASKTLLENHLLRRHKITRFVCKICGFAYKHESSLKRHIPTHSNFKNFTCTLCVKHFTRSDNWKVHMMAYHGNMALTKNLKCGIEQNINDKKQKSIKEAHQVVVKTIVNKKKLVSKRVEILRLSDRTNIYSCPLCPFTHSNCKNLEQHLLNNHRFKMFICAQCGRTLTNIEHLRRHSKRHRAKVDEAEMRNNIICAKSTDSVAGNNKNYAIVCTICKKSFRYRFGLVRHEKLFHGAEKKLAKNENNENDVQLKSETFSAIKISNITNSSDNISEKPSNEDIGDKHESEIYMEAETFDSVRKIAKMYNHDAINAAAEDDTDNYISEDSYVSAKNGDIYMETKIDIGETVLKAEKYDANSCKKFSVEQIAQNALVNDNSSSQSIEATSTSANISEKKDVAKNFHPKQGDMHRAESHQSGSEKKEFVCTICQTSFVRRLSLVRHSNLLHNAQKMQSGQNEGDVDQKTCTGHSSRKAAAKDDSDVDSGVLINDSSDEDFSMGHIDTPSTVDVQDGKSTRGNEFGMRAKKQRDEIVAVLPTPQTSERPNGAKLGKNPLVAKRAVKKKSIRSSVLDEPYPNFNVAVKSEKLVYDENGQVTWPTVLRGHKVNIAAALEDLKNWDQRGQKRKRAVCPPKDQMTYKQKFVVESIEKMEFDQLERVHLFYVKWEGYHHECNTWEPLEHLDGAEGIVSRFLEEKYTDEVLKQIAGKVDFDMTTLSDDVLFGVLPGLPGKKDLRQIPNKFLAQKRLLKFLDRNIHPTFVRMKEDGRKALLTYLLVKRRERQMTRLVKWENIINKMDKSEACITVENFVDLEPPPEKFCYINDYVPTGNIEIADTPDTYCLCTECGPGIKSCCGKQDHNAFTYTLKGKMNVNPGNAIYECNKLCKCGPSCRNRVVQHGRKVPLCIFRTDNGRGWGVKVSRKIACGEFVCEYVGEVIDHEEAERRGKAYDAEGRTYLFDLDYNSRDNLYTVDAAKYGNVSHFINHSCEPNLGVYATWINCLDPNLPKLALFALREVQKGEELTFDYMMNIDEPIIKPKTPEKTGRQKLDTPEKGTLVGSRPTCKCDADTCRRYLF